MLAASSVTADDVVTLSAPNSPQARSKVTGRVVDHTGRELTIEIGGTQKRFPAEQVIAIDSEWSDAQLAGDELVAKHDDKAALAQYEQALRAEPRRWVQRHILAQMIWCLRNTDQDRRAGELFLVLLRSDPATPYFACIPIRWIPGQPPADLEKKAREWLASDVPAAVLMGAGHLLSTGNRAAIVGRLEKLGGDSDPRVASLAHALVWNATFTSASPQRLQSWGEQVEKFPDALRAGPYFVLGRALAHHKRPVDAAVALLRVPILYPEDRSLAAGALLGAGRALEDADQSADAAQVYGELLADYAQTQPAVEARERLSNLDPPRARALSDDSTAAPYSDERFLDGLRSRQLFPLAEKFCREALARGDAGDAKRAALVIELSRSLVEEALRAPADKRDALWRQALEAPESLARDSSKNPRLVQVRVQLGLVQLAWGELLRHEAELTDRSKRLTAAREHLRGAIDALRQADDKTSEMLRRQQLGHKPERGELTNEELRALQKNVRYQLARALRSQGESYPPDSADRLNSLSQATELLGPLGQIEAAEPLAWPSRLDAAICYRLLGHADAAARRLDQIEKQSPPPRIALAARGERILLALAAGRVDEALALAEKPRNVESQTSPPLDYAALAAYLAAWRAALDAGQKSQAAEREARAVALVREIDQVHGPYWRRRAESLFAERVAATGAEADVALLSRAAEGFYRAGQLDEALTAYDRAADQAAKAGQADEALRLAYVAATIEQQRERFAAAADRFRRASIAHPKASKAAEAHLLSIYNLGQEARGGDPDVLARYATLLEEHLAMWPQAPTADRAHAWQARVLERKEDWAGAAQHYGKVRADSHSAGEAIDGLARSYQALLADMASTGQPTRETARTAVTALERFVGSNTGKKRHWNADQLRAVLAAARILLAYTDGEFAHAERLMAAAVDGAAEAPEDWKAAARGMLIFAIAAQGRIEEAGRRADELAVGSRGNLLPVVESLDRLNDAAPPAVRQNLGKLELRLLESLEGADGGATADGRALALARGRALAAAGRGDEAIKNLKQLAAENPEDGQVQEALANVLLDTGHDEALAAWQHVERKSRPGSDRWMRAKFGEALTLERRGERSRAAATVNLVKVLYPELGGPAQREKFLTLLRRCQ
ncbi:MAG: hypothetical protein HYX69_17315 [Planctomycetia bacterium]|nr:hypothetical protein [Planctomycetia bacterium]